MLGRAANISVLWLLALAVRMPTIRSVYAIEPRDVIVSDVLDDSCRYVDSFEAQGKGSEYRKENYDKARQTAVAKAAKAGANFYYSMYETHGRKTSTEYGHGFHCSSEALARLGASALREPRHYLYSVENLLCDHQGYDLKEVTWSADAALVALRYRYRRLDRGYGFSSSYEDPNKRHVLRIAKTDTGETTDYLTCGGRLPRRINSVRFRPDAPYLISAGRDLCVFDALTGRQIDKREDLTSEMTEHEATLSFTRRTRQLLVQKSAIAQLFTFRRDGTFQPWSQDIGGARWTRVGRTEHMLTAHPFAWEYLLLSAAFEPSRGSGTHVTGLPPSLSVIDSYTGSTLAKHILEKDGVYQARYSTSGTHLALLDPEGRLGIWRFRQGDLRWIAGGFRAIEFADDTTLVASNGSSLSIWDVNTIKKMADHSNAGRVDLLQAPIDTDVVIGMSSIGDIVSYDRQRGLQRRGRTDRMPLMLSFGYSEERDEIGVLTERGIEWIK